jgi:site-specific DNA-methyltransferase (adenine-specific)
MTTPYYQDESVTLYHGDCREITTWLDADVLVTDPPYGRGWKQGRHWDAKHYDDSHSGIVGDQDTTVRDEVLAKWLPRRAIVFGDLTLAPPTNTKQVLVYRKPPNAGARGAMDGYRRDLEAIYLLGAWQSGIGGRSSLITTNAPSQGNPSSPQGRYGHPHAKPLDVMQELILNTMLHVVADPFAGSGSTLVAAQHLGKCAIGVEIDERYCEIAARRLAQGVLDFGEVGA